MDSNSWRGKGPSDLRNEGRMFSGSAASWHFIFLMADSNQGLMQPKNNSGYRFWEQRVRHPNSTFFSLSVLLKTVENENFN